ncbi:MAG TPA: methyltransferase domain-containing protein [Myxococcota bacterium]
MGTGDFDAAKAAAFGQRVMDVVNGASLALMTSVGHQTGLFDRMAELPAATSREIAEAADLDERYVREWLGAMVTGRFVEYDPESATYRLPPEHAACLTRAAGVDNLAITSQYVALLGAVEQKIVSCFRRGGGVPYAEFERFQHIVGEESAALHDVALLETTLPLVPGLLERLRAGIDVLDVGCGSGHAVNLMARAFPQSRFSGYDFSSEAVERARSGARALGLRNVRFEVRDAADPGDVQAYDFVTAFDAIHDQAQPAAVLEGVARALRADGVFLMVDVAASSHVHENLDHPMAPYLYTVSCMHCMTVSLALGGAGLGAMWGEQKAREMLAAAGFGRVEVKRIESDLFGAYYIAYRR